MKYQKTILCCILLIGLVGYRLFKPTTAANEKSNLIIGTATGYAPFVSINPQGQYEGFDIDFANSLAKQMDKNLIIKDLGSMTSLFIALEQGTIDAIIWGMSIIPDRLEKSIMIHYQGSPTRSYPLLFWQTIPTGIQNIEDMHNKTICVEPNSSQDAVLRQYNGITILPTEKVDDALLNIQYGKADAAFVEPAIAAKFKAKFPQIKSLDITLADSDQVNGIGVVLKKTNTPLATAMVKAIDTLKANDIITALEQKWDIPA